ncbi:hypothetical protein CHARACLAT_010988 [Characodon lateralis]|uniref:Uncharacterized protein n=1 Tax=Characodon lateralis TaxID=208331 RepID=A0ABU7DSB7_9TELE|nr:hypothetical protein [Characodon lateralis]
MPTCWMGQHELRETEETQRPPPFVSDGRMCVAVMGERERSLANHPLHWLGYKTPILGSTECLFTICSVFSRLLRVCTCRPPY